MSLRRGEATAAAVLVAVLVGLLAACNPSPTPPPGPTGPAAATASPAAIATSAVEATFDPDATRPPIAFEGLYAGNDVSVTGDATVTVVRSAMACPALEHMIGAGEWAIVGRKVQEGNSAAGALSITMLSLQNGSDTALAWLAGGESCTARIARTTSAPLRVTGAATFDGSSALDVPFCIASGAKVALGATYRTPGGPNVQVSVVAPARTGSTRLDVEDVTLSVTRSTMTMTQLIGVLVEAFKDPDKGHFAEEYRSTDASRVRLDVETVDPFVGTLHVTDFEGPAGTISLDAQVACHLPGGTLQRVAAAAAVPPATTPPGTPGPTLEPFDGAAPGTVVITGSSIAGTYRLAASDLDCYYDFDGAVWTVLTAGGADPTFYLYASAAEGGGSTDQVSMGLVLGDGANGRLFLFDSRVSPPDGAAKAIVALSGGTVTIVVQGRASTGATMSANLSCTAS